MTILSRERLAEITRRARRWKLVTALCTTVLVVIGYRTHQHVIAQTFYGLWCVFAWMNFSVQQRAYHRLHEREV